jgi:uncharacterized protein (TIGR00369 family)
MSKKSLIQHAYTATRALPSPLDNITFSRLFGTSVKFAGHSDVEFLEAGPQRVKLRMKNKRKLQNHIGTVHAVAMSLLAESASGSIVALNLDAGKLALCKGMYVDFTRRTAKGEIYAEASLTDEQVELITTTPKGETEVTTVVTDSQGENPVEVRMVWAWVPLNK